MPTMFQSIFVVSFIISLTQHHFAICCVFKSSPPRKAKPGIWDLQSHSRKLYSPKCSCGGLSPEPPWNIKITTPYKSCTATVITSNLIATSHKCLILKANKKIQVYDTWNPRPTLTADNAKNVVTPDMITLSRPSATNSQPIPSSVKVKNIIFSTHYALSTIVSDGVVENDLALVVVEGNLFQHGFTPICIPTWKEGQDLDVIHQSAKYHDLMLITQMQQGEHSVIESGADCNANLKKSRSPDLSPSNDSLCVQYYSSVKLIEGGSLMITSASGDERVFLAGLASSTHRRSSLVPIYKFAYFTNIFPLVKYIEFHAQKVDSLWCESAPIKSGPKMVPPTGTKLGEWNLLKPTRNREEVLDCACGIMNDGTADARIAGGVDAVPYGYPWMVFLKFGFAKKKKTSWYNCGGSIINDRMILTAAHCVVQIDKKDGTVKVAIETKTFYFKYYYGQDKNQLALEVDTIYYHPDYVEGQKDNGRIDNDIAFITLLNPIDFSTLKEKGGMRNLRPVCLSKMSNPRPITAGDLTEVIGWGLTDPNDGRSTPEKLQKLDAPILPERQCQKFSGSISYNMLCAGYRNMYRDAAKGDSGGPLMVRDNTHFSQWGGQLFELGLVSFGQDFRTDPNDPDKITITLGVYTNVQKYTNVIDFLAEMEGAKWCKQP